MTQRFLISLGECELDVEQVWPDGGAPDSPTAEDVVNEMRKCGAASTVASEWNLLDLIEVVGLHDRSRAELR